MNKTIIYILENSNHTKNIAKTMQRFFKNQSRINNELGVFALVTGTYLFLVRCRIKNQEMIIKELREEINELKNTKGEHEM